MNRDWHGPVALVLALGLSLGWASALIIAALPVTNTISDQGANLLATVGGLMGGAVAAYLGARSAEHTADRRRPFPPPPDSSQVEILDTPPPDQPSTST
jgi:membrane associated rhomboid family serine protease